MSIVKRVSIGSHLLSTRTQLSFFFRQQWQLFIRRNVGTRKRDAMQEGGAGGAASSSARSPRGRTTTRAPADTAQIGDAATLPGVFPTGGNSSAAIASRTIPAWAVQAIALPTLRAYHDRAAPEGLRRGLMRIDGPGAPVPAIICIATGVLVRRGVVLTRLQQSYAMDVRGSGCRLVGLTHKGDVWSLLNEPQRRRPSNCRLEMVDVSFTLGGEAEHRMLPVIVQTGPSEDGLLTMNYVGSHYPRAPSHVPGPAAPPVPKVAELTQMLSSFMSSLGLNQASVVEIFQKQGLEFLGDGDIPTRARVQCPAIRAADVAPRAAVLLPQMDVQFNWEGDIPSMQNEDGSTTMDAPEDKPVGSSQVTHPSSSCIPGQSSQQAPLLPSVVL